MQILLYLMRSNQAMIPMMRQLVLILLLPALVYAQPTTQPQRRAGFRIVDGYWIKPQATLNLKDLMKVTDENGRHQLRFEPSKEIEPMLRNGRTSVVEIQGSNFAWKFSSPNRIWNEQRTEGIQSLELIAAADEMNASPQIALTRISIRPDVAIVQAIIEEDQKVLSVIALLSENFVELSITPAGQVNSDRVLRAPSARLLLRDHPIETRNYLIPILQILASNSMVMQPAAGDVYRAFPDVPVDPIITEVLSKIIPDLADPDPKFRNRASRDLQLLGRRGVQSAMQIDLEKIPPEAADRMADYIREHTHDERPADLLRINSNFLLDCLADPDPNIRNAAGDAIKKITKSSH